MKILVIGGMHGNEPLGPKVVKLFQEKPLKGIDTLLANEKAINKNCRFIKNDLNRSFPGNINSVDYEIKRADQILKIAKKYNLVLDFHNTMCPNNDCAFVGKSADKSLYSISSVLGLKRIIVADYDCINKFAPNCISVEVSLKSPKNNPEFWYKKIVSIQKSKISNRIVNIKLYRFVYRMTLEDRDKLDLKNKNLRAFKKIPAKLAKALNIDSPAYPIFIGDGYTPYNYGGLLNKLDANAVIRLKNLK